MVFGPSKQELKSSLHLPISSGRKILYLPSLIAWTWPGYFTHSHPKSNGNMKSSSSERISNFVNFVAFLFGEIRVIMIREQVADYVISVTKSGKRERST